ncbi:MAG: hypothetical protein E7636_05635 [Ruminococcaceae bacterium]|nr:hypothetical protein [Oscillospiraceae bacterium]
MSSKTPKQENLTSDLLLSHSDKNDPSCPCQQKSPFVIRQLGFFLYPRLCLDFFVSICYNSENGGLGDEFM